MRDLWNGLRRRCAGVGILCAAAALSVVAALIHLWVMPEHFKEWWGYGSFFLVVAATQAFYGVALLQQPTAEVFALGVAVNLGLLILYGVTRTLGIPFFGPHAGHVEAVEALGVAANTVELALILLLLVALRRRPQGFSQA